MARNCYAVGHLSQKKRSTALHARTPRGGHPTGHWCKAVSRFAGALVLVLLYPHDQEPRVFPVNNWHATEHVPARTPCTGTRYITSGEPHRWDGM